MIASGAEWPTWLDQDQFLQKSEVKSQADDFSVFAYPQVGLCERAAGIHDVGFAG